MFISKFPQALEINICTRTTICNTCEQINMPGDILNAGVNIEELECYGFTEYFSKKSIYHYG